MSLKAIILITYLAVTTALLDYRRCLLHRGKCVSYCPRKMHAYHTRCDGETMTQKTCDSPEASLLGYTCGWSRCDCNGNLVYDEKSGFCVTLEFCEQNKFPDEVRRKHGDTDMETQRRTKIRPSKRIKIPDDDPLVHLT
ncbi:uncharacterized protein LOC110995057 [Pieris rapae]|uniref:uncharacterized protein LOC110995057 n=1 Tax=Pieris rapae TaxID=64459 RepID=UPI001E27E86B|nr:uncharacterized protein LOC110995057 [Pieris rapae]